MWKCASLLNSNFFIAHLFCSTPSQGLKRPPPKKWLEHRLKMIKRQYWLGRQGRLYQNTQRLPCSNSIPWQRNNNKTFRANRMFNYLRRSLGVLENHLLQENKKDLHVLSHNAPTKSLLFVLKSQISPFLSNLLTSIYPLINLVI